jgi:hypothetical protein
LARTPSWLPLSVSTSGASSSSSRALPWPAS